MRELTRAGLVWLMLCTLPVAVQAGQLNHANAAKLVQLLLVVGTRDNAHRAVNINRADAAVLSRHLRGVTPSLAEGLVEYRERNGPFASFLELLKIQGFGKHLIAHNRNNMKL